MLNHAETSVDRRRGPGAGRQGPVAQGPAAQAALDRVRRSARPVRLRRPDAALVRRACSRTGRAFGAARNPASTRPSWPRAAPTTSRMIAYTSGTTGTPKGVMLQPSQHGRGGRRLHRRRTTSAPATTGCPTCRWRGSAMPPSRSAWRSRCGCVCQLPGESRRRVQRDLRELGPQRDAGAAAHLGEHADRRCRSRAATPRRLKRRMFEHFRGAGRALRADADRRQAAAAGRAPGARARRGPGLRTGARPARAAQRALVLHRRRAARARHLPLLPLLRRQPQAGLRRDRGLGADRLPARRRGQSQHGRAGRCRASTSGSTTTARCMLQGPERVRRLLQAGRGDARDHGRRTAGCRPATPASSTSRASS